MTTLGFIFWLVLAVCVVAALAAFVILARKKAIVPWDMALFVVPFIFWWCLLSTNLRPKTLSNFIEPFALLPILAVIFVVRAFAGRNLTHEKRSKVVFIIGMIATLGIYVLVPGLPE